MLETYIKRHNPIWPEMELALRTHGVSNYTIFHRPGTDELFGYFEIADETRFSQLADQEVCQQWWLEMAELLECERPDSKKGREELLEEIFHLT